MKEIITFSARCYFPRFYEGRNMGPDPKGPEIFGCSIESLALPKDLVQFASVSKASEALVALRPDLANTFFAKINQRNGPEIVTHDNRGGMREIASLIEFMKASNLRPDLLFDGVKADFAVSTITREPKIARMRLVAERSLYIHAVRFDYTSLIASYDALCARYFADPTLPYKGPPV